MQKRKFDELVSYFNKEVSEMEIGTKYKMELLGMVTALGCAHEKEMSDLSEIKRDSSDLISRQAAIDIIDLGRLCNPNEPRWSDNEVVNFLKSRPSAQGERPRGRWIMHIDDLFPGESTIECDRCHAEQPLTCDDNYCPNCGAFMENGGDNE